jgi:hypothetical protein
MNGHQRLVTSAQTQTNDSSAAGPHTRPDGVDDTTVEAVGRLTEALEYVERARGALFNLHQLIGRGDILAEEAADLLDSAGHETLAEQIRTDVVGRNVLDGRWTFQIVEEFERTYYEPFREAERLLRDQLLDGKRHVFEAEMKERRRTRGRARHEQRPPAHDPALEAD